MSRVLLPFSLVFGIATAALTAGESSFTPERTLPQREMSALPLGDTLPPIRPRFGDFVTDSVRNPIDLKDPSAVEKNVEYDPVTDRYIITEKIGDEFFRPPTYMTFQEYLEYSRKQQEQNYFRQLAGINTGGSNNSALDPIARIDVKNSLIDRLFGGTAVDIRPQGGIDLTFGYDYQQIENPILAERQRRQGVFDFDMNIQMNVSGKIGEKLALSTNYNTNATFDFDNQIKLNYNADQFGEDEIIKRIDAGNVSLPLRGSLIQGAQSLFGVITELQFGRLYLTAVASQQKSQRESIQIKDGGQVQEFEVRADEYDENRHFFLTHYNRATFEDALSNLPQVKSLFKVNSGLDQGNQNNQNQTNQFSQGAQGAGFSSPNLQGGASNNNLTGIEIWITNDRNEVDNVRDVVAFADLAEPVELVNPTAITPTPGPTDINGQPLPDNSSNNLYQRLLGRPDIRSIDQAVNILQNEFGLQQARDFEKVSARKLQPSEYTIHPELGFISLNVNVQPDQVIGVAFTYSYNGRAYKVGELSQNSEATQPDSSLSVLYVKMLKSTTQRIDVSTWDLMMKNVYSIGAFQVNREDFRLDVFYDDPGKGFKRFLPETNLQGQPLLRVFNLDLLNVQGDPQPDGVFDFVPGITINPRNGRIMFPVLEPFGSSLAAKIEDSPEESKYIYQELYDLTLFQAQEFPEKNRYVIRGRYKSTVSNEISLGAFNIPPGSVQVTAGGQILREGADYEIDYNIGRVKILNDAILNSGVPINVSYEDNTFFGFQLKSMFGLRADYKIDENFNIGGTFLQLLERPFTQKVNIGDDPINNRIYGFDINFSRPAPWLTKAVDFLPLLSTRQASSIALTAETAILSPGHSRAINQNREDKGGVVYVDDFEGATSSFDLRQPANQWFLASVPQNDEMNNNPLFPEANLLNDIRSGANRARLNWFRIDQGIRGGDDVNNPYTSLVPQVEVFPNAQIPPDQLPNVQTLDLAYYPGERGPYNFDVPNGYPGLTDGVAFNGDSMVLVNPETRWGGIMRALNTNDFQSANIEFLEFWLLSPFLDPSDPSMPVSDFDRKEGTLYINLGNVSEDILRDSRKFFENGLPGPFNPNRRVDTTAWSVIPIAQQITRAFDNDPETRRLQDVGLDGLDDEGERRQFRGYLEAIGAVNSVVAEKLARDPANDNYRYYRDESFPPTAGILERYRDYNNPEGNSRENEVGSTRVQSGTNIPDAEDLNRDNTLNETETYFQYTVPLRADPLNPREIDQNLTPFITDRLESEDGRRVWYRFRVPLNGDDKVAVGGIKDFRSIRFIRMYLREFRDPVVLRFARLELVRNTWRRYTQPIEENVPPCDQPTEFDTDVVNIERNSSRRPFNYVLPEGIQREQALGVFNTLQNEQSVSMIARNLCEGDSRAIFKTINLDMRVYERFKMFVHAEELDRKENGDGELSLFVRLGSDFKNNFYEYEIPLVMSDSLAVLDVAPNSSEYKREVWRDENKVDFALKLLTDVKQDRNNQGFPVGQDFERILNPDNPQMSHRVRVRGNPNVGYVKVAMVGIRNRRGGDVTPLNTEVWINEMRLTGLDERGGVAAIARMDMELADFGNVTVAGNMSSIGFGALDQKVQQRQREAISGFDVSASLQLGKFFPENWGIRLPFYTQYSRAVRSPEFDPYDLDIRLKEKLANAGSPRERDSIRLLSQDVSSIRSYTFTNVGKDRRGSRRLPMPWDIENFSFNYAFSETERRDPIIEFDRERRQTAGMDYTFGLSPKYIEPFKGVKGKWLQLISQLNFNPLPNSFTFSTVMDRRFATTRWRFTGLDDRFNTFFNKSFLWDRNYSLQWDLTRALKFTFNATNNSVIDEPEEDDLFDVPNPRQVRNDSIWKNIRDFGRTKNYIHNFQISYQAPLRFIPLLDWIQVRGQYQAEYAWSAAALNVDSLGNVIQNRQDRQLSADLNFEGLYNKSGFLREINRNRSGNAGGRPTAPGQQQRPQPQQGQQQDDGKKRGPGVIERTLIRPFLLLRRARLNYTERFSTVVPGYMPQSRMLGMAPGFDSPGFDFITGAQPRIRGLDPALYGTRQDWLAVAASKGWITSNVLLNREVVQEYNQNLDARVTIEPIQDFRVELEITRNFTDNHTEFFKDTLRDGITDFVHAVPKSFGSMTVTYSALRTLFQDSNDEIRTLFQTFENNRVIISRRLGTGEHVDPILAELGYTSGYGRTQQDVLIPAFISAYTQQDPNTVNTDIFKQRPQVNWRLTYNGLSRLPLFRDLFQNFSLSHAYRSTLTVNNFSTGLDWLRTRDNSSGPLNELNGNFYPRLEIPQVAITEAFSPLIAVDATFKNGMSLGVDYKKARTLGMSFVSNQLSETQTKEFTIAFGWLLRNVDIPLFKARNSRSRRPQNQQQQPSTNQPGPGNQSLQGRDLDISFNLSMRDDVTFNHLLDQGVVEPTRGNYALSFSPAAEYQLSRNLALRLFFDFRRNEPKTSAGFPRTDASGGVVVRFKLN